MSRNRRPIALLVMLLALAGAVEAQDRINYLATPVSPEAVLLAGAAGPAGAPGPVGELVTGFEAPEFGPGPIFLQNGWDVVLGSSLVEGHIDTVNPNSGAQHLRLSLDPDLDPGENGIFTASAFSPILAPQPAAPSQVSAYVAIGAAEGADYRIQPQAVAEGMLTAVMQFSFLGNIFALDEDLNFVDTGVPWTPGPYVEARIEVDPGSDSVEYYYDGALILSTGIIAGTTIDNVLFGSDNFNLAESGDFDDLRFPTAAPATATLEVPTLGQSGIIALVALIAMVGILRLRSGA